MSYSLAIPLSKQSDVGRNSRAAQDRTMEVKEINSALQFDRILFQIHKTHDGFIVTEEQYLGSNLVLKKELGIVYAKREDAIRAMDSLVRLSKQSFPQKTIDWKD